MQTKDISGLQDCCAAVNEPYRSALLRLPELYGGAELLAVARAELPPLPEVISALEIMQALQASLSDLPLSFDLADLRGYNYHNGIVFSAYFPGLPGAIARGGRYDGVGKTFGRERPATGFSMDLREVTRLSGKNGLKTGILAPYSGGNSRLIARMAQLRSEGEIVVELLPGESQYEGPLCDRQLVEKDGEWLVQRLEGSAE